MPILRAKWLVAVGLITIFWTNLGWFGQMPVGGDASRFGLGLMGSLSSALSENRVPAWNSLWGYGFPALAESQLGVFYPPHLLIYKTLPLEAAYSFDMALHALWAALGAWLLARQMGCSPWASALAAVSFVTSGFFLVHEPHHWSWPTGSWLPWIFLAGLSLMRPNASKISEKIQKTLLLAAFIAMPVLTGHFQLGFIAMVSLCIFWLAMMFTTDKNTPHGQAWPALPFLFAAFAIALALTMVQVLPTWELAQQANQQRNWEYLSGFAAPPSHLIGLLLPALGRTATFWRPLLWDQFHTSPEELFFYVGLVPLWLAGLAMARLVRTEPLVKALAITLLAVLLLAAGPYVPGFSMLIRLPGFSFFRAPARWTLAATLILAILAARGLDLLMHEPARARSSLKRFCLASLALIASAIGLIEISARLTSPRPGQESTALSLINQARPLLIPAWDDRKTVEDWVRRSRSTDAAAIPAYAKPYTNLSLTSFNRDRLAAYSAEVLPQVVLILALLAGASLAGQSRQRLVACLSLVMLADLAILSRLRSIETAPMKAIAEQSPVMDRLRQLALNHDWPLATWGDLGNLPMAVGASPIRAYRTMDIPVMPELNDRLMRGLDEKSLALARLAGVGVLVFDPPTWAQIRGRWASGQKVEEINDPTLWAWMTTRELAKTGPTTFGLIALTQPLGRAWKIVMTDLTKNGISQTTEATNAANIDRLPALARRLAINRPVPEHILIHDAANGKELWLIAQWAAPGWQARLTNDQGEIQPANIIALAGGWQGIEIPHSGNWQLDLIYQPISEPWGLRISGISGLLFIGFMIYTQLSQSGTPEAENPK